MTAWLGGLFWIIEGGTVSAKAENVAGLQANMGAVCVKVANPLAHVWVLHRTHTGSRNLRASGAEPLINVMANPKLDRFPFHLGGSLNTHNVYYVKSVFPLHSGVFTTQINK